MLPENGGRWYEIDACGGISKVIAMDFEREKY